MDAGAIFIPFTSPPPYIPMPMSFRLARVAGDVRDVDDVVGRRGAGEDGGGGEAREGQPECLEHPSLAGVGGEQRGVGRFWCAPAGHYVIVEFAFRFSGARALLGEGDRQAGRRGQGEKHRARGARFRPVGRARVCGNDRGAKVRGSV